MQKTPYEKWLLRYAVYLGVAVGLKRGASGFTLDEVMAELDDDGLLDGMGKTARDRLAVEAFQVGPFRRAKAAGPLVVYDGVRADDFPCPGRAPR